MKKGSLVLACAIIAAQALLVAGGWEKLEDCKFHEGSHSDGDSVEVLRNGRRHIFRLYFVDCIERNPASRARRAVQARYFGLREPSENAALRAAYLASAFTRTELSQPFTVFTRWQRVDKDSGNPAVRAFVETARGDDLSMLLVSEGLAIVRHGRRAVSDHPDGRSSGEFVAALEKAERQARAMKRGAWGLAEGDTGANPREIFEATDMQALVANAGRQLKVRGRVTRVGRLPGRMTFLNFDGHRGKGAFVGIVRQKFQSRFSNRFPDGLDSLTGKYVVLQGTITLYRGAPQIELESPGQIHLEP